MFHIVRLFKSSMYDMVASTVHMYVIQYPSACIEANDTVAKDNLTRQLYRKYLELFHACACSISRPFFRPGIKVKCYDVGF